MNLKYYINCIDKNKIKYKNGFSQYLNLSKIKNAESPKESILINSLSLSYFSQ